MSQHLAIDIGSSSTRVVLLRLQGKQTEWLEITCFTTPQQWRNGRLCWDLAMLWQRLIDSLADCRRRFGQVETLAVDSFGVDYQLLDSAGNPLGECLSYRDPQTRLTLEQLQPLDEEWLFVLTGGSFPVLGTLHQLRARLWEEGDMVDRASLFLSVADYIIYRLTGNIAMERSQASTTLMWDTRRDKWRMRALRMATIPPRLVPPVITAGQEVGPLQHDLARLTGLDACRVIAVCSHDTANFSAAFPQAQDNIEQPFAFVNCGTWAIIGSEQSQPIVNVDVWHEGATNECSRPHRCQTLFNLPGMWFVQQLGQELAPEREIADLLAEAWHLPPAEVIPPCHRLDITDPIFMDPGCLSALMQQQAGQERPLSTAQLVRLAQDSLLDALMVRVEALSNIHEQPLQQIAVAGGGSRDRQFVEELARRSGCTVLRGFHEATLLGNFHCQLTTYDQLTATGLDVTTLLASNPLFLPEVITPDSLSCRTDWHHGERVR